jgi:hypothetical protein
LASASELGWGFGKYFGPSRRASGYFLRMTWRNKWVSRAAHLVNKINA